MQKEESPTRSFDARLSLTWVLSALGAIAMAMASILWNVAGQNGKLDQLIIANSKLEKRLDDRDNRLDAMRDKQYSNERVVDALTMRIDSIERTVRK